MHDDPGPYETTHIVYYLQRRRFDLIAMDMETGLLYAYRSDRGKPYAFQVPFDALAMSNSAAAPLLTLTVAAFADMPTLGSYQAFSGETAITASLPPNAGRFPDSRLTSSPGFMLVVHAPSHLETRTCV